MNFSGRQMLRKVRGVNTRKDRPVGRLETFLFGSKHWICQNWYCVCVRYIRKAALETTAILSHNLVSQSTSRQLDIGVAGSVQRRQYPQETGQKQTGQAPQKQPKLSHFYPKLSCQNQSEQDSTGFNPTLTRPFGTKRSQVQILSPRPQNL